MKYLLLSLVPLMLMGCTITFQNIDTHGSASDLIDENQTASPTVSPTLTLPISS